MSSSCVHLPKMGMQVWRSALRQSVQKSLSVQRARARFLVRKVVVFVSSQPWCRSVTLFQKTVLSCLLSALRTVPAVPWPKLSRFATNFLEDLRFVVLYGVVRFIMENGAKGCEVVISG